MVLVFVDVCFVCCGLNWPSSLVKCKKVLERNLKVRL